MPARPTTPVTTPAAMAGQSETLTACAAAAIASCIGCPSILPGAERGLLLFQQRFLGTFPAPGRLYRKVLPMSSPSMDGITLSDQ
jgi:hypothetical protein